MRIPANVMSVAVVALLHPVAASAQQAPGEWVTTAQVSRQGRDFTEDLTKLYDGGFSYSAWERWITAEDMPAEVRTRAFSSSTWYALDLDLTGKVSDCRVLKPSTDPRLDAIGCRKLLQNANFGVAYAAPGTPAGRKINVAISWRTVPRPATPPLVAPAVPMPMPVSALSEYNGWPRRNWEGGLAITHFPDLQTAYPAQTGKPAGTTTLELTAAADGTTACTVAVGSGNPALDAAACATARNLPLIYTQPCEACGTRRLPLQFVWRKKGSHIRVPLAAEGGTGIARDPADTRSPSARAITRTRYTATPDIKPRDFADIADRTVTVRRPAYAMLFGADGRVTRCETSRSSGNPAVDQRICALIAKQLKAAPVTDIFGDPVPSPRTAQIVDLSGLL